MAKRTATAAKTILGTKLRELRESHGLTQDEVAAHVDKSQSAVSSWERDQSAPTSWQQKKLAVLFKVPLHDLAELAADYEERFENGQTNRREDQRPNHHARK